jgi:predicted transcriptional regulator
MPDQRSIRDIMVKPVTIAKSQAITEALDKMLDEGIDPLIALSGHEVVGTISRKSIADKLGSRQKAPVATAKIHIAGSVDANFTAVSPDQEITTLVPLLQRSKLVVVYDQNHRLVGQVGYGELLSVLQPKGSVDNVMEPAHTIGVNERVQHLQHRMTDDGISRFVVTEGNQLAGIVTETDIAVSMRRFREKVQDRHQDFHLHNLLIRAVMTSPLHTVNRNGKVSEIVDLMLKRKISSVPVTDHGRLVGMVTRQSLVNAL